MQLMRYLSLCLLFVFLRCTICDAQISSEKDTICKNIYLPSAVAAYTFFIQAYPDTIWRIQENNNSGIRYFKKLGYVFDSVQSDFNEGLVFIRQVVILDMHGPIDTIVQEKYNKIPVCARYGTLYISTPFSSNRVLLVLSSVAPVHTLILLLDSIPSAKLVYDSFKDTNWYDGYGSLGVVTKVEKGWNERYYLFESVINEEWQTQFFPRKQRIFTLDLKKKPAIQLFMGN